MSRLLTAVSAASALTLAACGPRVDPAQQKTFDSCSAAAAKEFPSTCRPGELCADARQIEGLGASMETCMSSLGYRYDESRTGCQLPPPYNARYYQLKSDVTCYSSATSR